MNLQVTGTIVQLLDRETGVSPRGEWKRRAFVLETNGQYPKKICFTALSKMVETVDGLIPGKEATVHFYVESREHNDKWFNRITPLKIETATTVSNSNSEEANEEDDLPW